MPDQLKNAIIDSFFNLAVNQILLWIGLTNMVKIDPIASSVQKWVLLMVKKNDPREGFFSTQS